MTSTEIEKACFDRWFLFYTTHVNDPLPAAVGLKVLDVVVRDDLVDRSRKVGFRLKAGLEELKKKYRRIGDVRGRGLMCGVEIVANKETKEPATDLGEVLATKLMELGFSAKYINNEVFWWSFQDCTTNYNHRRGARNGFEYI